MADASSTVPGGFVVFFEGLDGVGKTTQLNLAREALEKEHRVVHPTRNLGGTPIGEALREVTLSPTPRSALTDFYISVAIQVALTEAVAEDRKDGKITLIDRGPLSFAAYHMYGSGVDPKVGWRYVDQGMRDFKPDLVILYSTSLKTALGRAKRRAGKTDYFASKPDSYFKRVLEGFDEAKARYPVKEIDAAKSIKEVHAETMAAINAALRKHKH